LIKPNIEVQMVIAQNIAQGMFERFSAGDKPVMVMNF
jgi:hypothetical protein